MKKVRVYLDSGASLSKDLYQFCEFYQFPYDSSDRPKNKTPQLALPSELTWEQFNCRWEEANFSWSDCGHPVPDKLKKLIGQANKADYKHICSALRMSCQAFLTSDKTDIWSKRADIEAEYGIKIFHIPSQEEELRIFIKSQKN